MSSRLRKETNCLNCGAEVVSQYCPECGQENTVHPESFLSMVRHYFDDLTHFDSKLFLSIWFLISKPGYLTNVFNEGKRKKYVHPIRMYIFISVMAFSFLFFSSHKIINPKLGLDNNTSTDVEKFQNNDNDVTKIKIQGKPLHKSNWKLEIDSLIQTSKKDKNEGWLQNTLQPIFLGALISFRNNPDQFVGNFLNNFLHNLPKTLLFSLPFFAVFLHIIFFNRQRFFTNSVIFSIHFHVFLLICVLFLLILNQFQSFLFINVLFLFVPAIYLFKSLRKVYKNNIFATFIKFLVLTFLYFIVFFSLQLMNLFYSLSSSNSL